MRSAEIQRRTVGVSAADREGRDLHVSAQYPCEKNQRLNLQRMIQPSDAERTPGRAAEHADAEVWSSSKPNESAASGSVAWSTTRVRPSGGAWGPGDAESSSWQAQPHVVPQHRWAGGLGRYSWSDESSEFLPAQQYPAVREAPLELGPCSASFALGAAAAQVHIENGRV